MGRRLALLIICIGDFDGWVLPWQTVNDHEVVTKKYWRILNIVHFPGTDKSASIVRGRRVAGRLNFDRTVKDTLDINRDDCILFESKLEDVFLSLSGAIGCATEIKSLNIHAWG